MSTYYFKDGLGLYSNGVVTEVPPPLPRRKTDSKAGHRIYQQALGKWHQLSADLKSCNVPEEHRPYFEALGTRELKEGVDFMVKRQWLREKANEWLDVDEKRAINYFSKTRYIAIPVPNNKLTASVTGNIDELSEAVKEALKELVEKGKQHLNQAPKHLLLSESDFQDWMHSNVESFDGKLAIPVEKSP